jgi:hypothetical protein
MVATGSLRRRDFLRLAAGVTAAATGVSCRSGSGERKATGADKAAPPPEAR